MIYGKQDHTKQEHKKDKSNDREIRCTPKPTIGNADFRAKSKGLCIFMKSLNLLDLALNKMEKAKPALTE